MSPSTRRSSVRTASAPSMRSRRSSIRRASRPVPGKTPSLVLEALVTQRYPIPASVWDDFWDRLASKTLHPGEALAVVTALTSRLPDGESVAALLGSLRERNPQPPPPTQPTVNIVG